MSDSKFEIMDKEAINAFNIIRAYCKERIPYCENCVFTNTGYDCNLTTYDYSPRSWRLHDEPRTTFKPLQLVPWGKHK